MRKTKTHIMRLFLLIFASLCMLGCDKDDDIITAPAGPSFLDEMKPQFRAKLNDSMLFYKFDVGAYQMSSAALFPNGDNTDPARFLRFVLNQENGDNQFLISAPIYDTSSASAFNSVFGIGSKPLGDSGTDYNIQIRNNHNTFILCDESANYSIEIMKTEEVNREPPNFDELYVWFKIDDIQLNDCGNVNDDLSLKNGLILASFIDYKNY